jgi:elongation factor 1-alpha
MISASRGEFEAGIIAGGMTREESLVAYTNGVRQFIVLINKMDTVDYSLERFNEVKSEVLDYLKKLGLDINTVPVIPISAWLGENLTELSGKVPWYKGWEITRGGEKLQGITLLDAINCLAAPPRALEKPLRIPILRVHKIGGVGTVAVGRVASGVLQTGQPLVIMPNGIETQSMSIEIFHSTRKEGLTGDLIGFK